MRAASTFASAFSSQDLCSKAGLNLLKTVNVDVPGPQGLNFDGAIIASGETGVSVLWFVRTSNSIELFCAEPIQSSSIARSIVETFLQ